MRSSYDMSGGNSDCLCFDSMWFCDRDCALQRCLSPCWPFPHCPVGFLTGLGVLHLREKWTAQLRCTVQSFEDEGRPCMAEPGVSGTYHHVCCQFERWWPLGFHSMAVSRALSWEWYIHFGLSGGCLMGVDPMVAICTDALREEFWPKHAEVWHFHWHQYQLHIWGFDTGLVLSAQLYMLQLLCLYYWVV